MDSVPRRRSTQAWAALCAVAVIAISQAQAHARLAGADPAPHSTVSAPARIRLRFSEDLAKKFCSITLAGVNASPVALVPVDERDARILVVAPAAALAAGQYYLSWVAVASDDGHKTTGTFSFTVK